MKQSPGIFAFATSSAGYAVSLLRLSGEGVFDLCQKATSLKGPIKPRHAYYLEFSTSVGVVDDVLVTFFPGPKSYTGEDMVEIGFHGSPAIAAEVARFLLESGLALAEPGEFSRRAFLNEKLDMAQAEGVALLVEAQSLTQAKAARELSSGRFSGFIQSLRAKLISCLALLEAAMDFPDEDDTKHLEMQSIRPHLEGVYKELHQLTSQYQTGKQSLHGIRVAVLGEPNAGKSSLINALLGEERILVSPVAGTTRDYLEVPYRHGGELFWLLDTAGIRETKDAIEAAGIQLAWKCADKADVIVVLEDLEAPANTSNDLFKNIQEKVAGQKPVWRIGTKADLKKSGSGPQGCDCVVSTKSTGGLDDFRGLLEKYARSTFKQKGSSAQLVFTKRHLHHLQVVMEMLERLLGNNESLPAEEILSFELRDAIRELASIVGSIDNEEVLDQIFSSFCLGK